MAAASHQPRVVIIEGVISGNQRQRKAGALTLVAQEHKGVKSGFAVCVSVGRCNNYDGSESAGAPAFAKTLITYAPYSQKTAATVIERMVSSHFIEVGFVDTVRKKLPTQLSKVCVVVVPSHRLTAQLMPVMHEGQGGGGGGGDSYWTVVDVTEQQSAPAAAKPPPLYYPITIFKCPNNTRVSDFLVVYFEQHQHQQPRLHRRDSSNGEGNNKNDGRLWYSELISHHPELVYGCASNVDSRHRRVIFYSKNIAGMHVQGVPTEPRILSSSS